MVEEKPVSKLTPPAQIKRHHSSSSIASSSQSTSSQAKPKITPSPNEKQPNKKKKNNHPTPFKLFLKTWKWLPRRQDESISFDQLINFLEDTRKVTKSCESPRNLNLDALELGTVIWLIHPSLPDKSKKICLTKIANALCDNNENKISCIKDWSSPIPDN